MYTRHSYRYSYRYSYSSYNEEVDKFLTDLDLIISKNLNESLSTTTKNIKLKSSYRNLVFDMLSEGSEEIHKYIGINDNRVNEKLKELQINVEKATNDFTNPENVYSRYPKIMDILVKKDQPSAKDFLLSCKLNSTEKQIVNRFHLYQMELVCIKVLSLLFNEVEESTMVKLSTFVEQIANYLRCEVNVITKRRLGVESKEEVSKDLKVSKGKHDKLKDKNEKDINKVPLRIATLLLEFLIERKIVAVRGDAQTGKISKVKGCRVRKN